MDIGVAFATVLHPENGARSDVGHIPNPNQVFANPPNQAVRPDPLHVTSNSSAPAEQRGIVRRLIKSTLRSPVKILYRFSKPFIRPIAFRLRAYFLNSIREELTVVRRDIVHIRAEAVGLQQHMRSEAAHWQQVAQEEGLKFTDTLTHELRATGDSIQQDILARLLPPLEVLQQNVQQLSTEAEALAKAAAAPIQSPQLDRLEQLALDEATVRAKTVLTQSRKLDCIEQLAVAEAAVRAETASMQSLKLDRIEQLALDEANVTAETASRQSLKLEGIEQLARDEARVRAETAPTHSLRLDRIEQYSLLAARRFAINCGGEQVLVRTEVGFLLCSGADPALLSILIESGELEPGTRRVIQRILKPGDFFIDVGANVGLHTLAAARAMEGRGKIIAFEPFAETARLLENTVWLNGFSGITEIHQAAVSTATGTKSLYLGATSGHHSLFPLKSETGSASKAVEVPLMKIDDVVGKKQFVTLIKIDVEGAELQVLETAEQAILGSPGIAIIVEFGLSHLHRVGCKSADWLGAFTNLGLDYRAINEETGALEILSIDQLEAVNSVNLLFARNGSSLLLA